MLPIVAILRDKIVSAVSAFNPTSLKALAAELLRFSSKGIISQCALLLTTTLLSGLGLGLLLPLLQLLGVSSSGELTDFVTRNINSLAEYFGFDLTFPSVLALFVILLSIKSALNYCSKCGIASLQYGFLEKKRRAG